jgi:hypothetical protein
MSTVAVKRLDHVSFTVGDLNQSVAFYQRFRSQPIKSYSAEGSDTDEGTATTNAAMEIVWLGSESGNVRCWSLHSTIVTASLPSSSSTRT